MAQLPAAPGSRAVLREGAGCACDKPPPRRHAGARVGPALAATAHGPGGAGTAQGAGVPSLVGGPAWNSAP